MRNIEDKNQRIYHRLLHKKQSVKKNIIKEVEAQIQQKENELISSNYTHHVQLEKNMLVSILQNLVEDQKRGHKLEAGQNGWKRAKNVHNTSLTLTKGTVQTVQ